MNQMIYASKQFNVKTRIDVAPVGIRRAPSATDAATCFAVFGNQSYVALHRINWNDFANVLDFEMEYYEEISAAPDFEMALRDVDEAIYNNPDFPDFDFGMAAAVYALSALGCLCGYSCNGGAFGGYHTEEYPLIALIAPDAKLELIRKSAEEVGAGLERSKGTLLLYTDSIEKMMAFGPALYKRVFSSN